MSLDDKLEQLLKALVFDNWHDDGYLPSYKKAIKQAFADAGYLTPEQAKQVQELVNRMVDTAHKMVGVPKYPTDEEWKAAKK